MKRKKSSTQSGNRNITFQVYSIVYQVRFLRSLRELQGK